MAPAASVPAGWSRTVRMAHWLVATGVIVNLFNDTGFAHRQIGYAVLAVVGLRLLHGTLTPNPAERFFWPGVAELRAHIARLRHRRPESWRGHNPAGQLAVYAMWLLIGLLGLTGWLSRTDAFWGEDWPVDTHVLLANGLCGMLGLHLVAVLYISLRLRRNLVRPMLRDRCAPRG